MQRYAFLALLLAFHGPAFGEPKEPEDNLLESVLGLADSAHYSEIAFLSSSFSASHMEVGLIAPGFGNRIVSIHGQLRFASVYKVHGDYCPGFLTPATALAVLILAAGGEYRALEQLAAAGALATLAYSPEVRLFPSFPLSPFAGYDVDLIYRNGWKPVQVGTAGLNINLVEREDMGDNEIGVGLQMKVGGEWSSYRKGATVFGNFGLILRFVD